MDLLRLLIVLGLALLARAMDGEGELPQGGEEAVLAEATSSCGCKMSRESVLGTYEQIMDVHPDGSNSELNENLAIDALVVPEDMVLIPGGPARIGNDKPVIGPDGEGPRRKVTLSAFHLDRYTVTNEDFAKFVASTGFVTENERFGWSFVFHLAVPATTKSQTQQAVLGAEWWLPVNGSTWRWPEGPEGADVFASNRSDHPVVQVSWNDAVAFCQWRRARLPTEAEWEVASAGPALRTASTLTRFPWGDALLPNKTHRMNVFQGSFPAHNSALDGYAFTCPVWAFGPQNEYGLFNMLGNVWEWVQDWWTIEHARSDRLPLQVDPQGPSTGRDKVKKGGSFLCHRSYCYRYRLASRFQSTPDSAASNIGFRCARSSSSVLA